MSQEQQQFEGEEGEARQESGQQQQQPQPERHGGQGADSAMKQLREWEHRRVSNSGGKRRQGPS